MLTALLLVSLWIILDRMSQISAVDDTENELYEKRRRTNETFSSLYRVETMGQTLDLGKASDYVAYTQAVSEALAAVDSLKLFVNDSSQVLRADSIHMLLLEKVDNLRRFIRASASEDARKKARIESILAHQDTLLAIRSEQYRLLARSDSLMSDGRPHGFWGKLARAFSGDKNKLQYDSLKQVNAALSEYGDSLAMRLRNIETGYELVRDSVQNVLAWHKMQLERDNRLLSVQINRLMHEYEQELADLITRRSLQNEQIRRDTLNTVIWIAFIAIAIALTFGCAIWYILGKNNRYRTELEDANRRTAALLNAREKMMLAITHDFKAPLSSIIGYVSLLKRLVSGERERLYLDNMHESSQHLLALVNNLLDFYRLDSDKMTVKQVSFNPRVLFEKEVLAYRPVAEAKGLSLTAVFPADDDGRLCVGDPIKIRQIVDNLLSNAIKFTAAGTVVLRLAVTDDDMCFSVADTGCGMADEDLERIFGEFTRLSDAQGQEGFGLGLSITRKLVELLGGSITVTSEQGQGSRFTVRLPVTPFAGEVAADEAKPFDGVAALLLDDDNLQLAMFKGELENIGVRAVCCNHVEDAISHLRHEAYDVFFTDIQMPECNGFELLHRLRNDDDGRLRQIAVVAVSARSDMDMEQLRQHGFAAKLEKPFSQHELCAVLAGVLRQPAAVPLASQPVSDAAAGREADMAGGYDFSPLTAFAGDDAEARANILATCLSEMQEHASRMREAAACARCATLSQIAHKWVPLFTMLNDADCVSLLRTIEHMPDDNLLADAVEKVLQKADAVMAALRSLLQKE